jgi:pimeloyl-ACP methyl ester carboxylesterase
MRAVADEPDERALSSSPIPPWPGRFIDLPSGPVYVRTAEPAGAGAAGRPGGEPVNEAETVLLVHGLGGSSTNWTDLMDLLAVGRVPAVRALSCVAVDLPGFGYSPPPPDGRYSIRTHALSVIRLIEQLGQAPRHLIGNSLGGAVSTKVAALRPDLVRSLTLISPALPDLRPRPLPLRLAAVTAPGVGVALIDRMSRHPASGRTDMSIRELFYDPGAMHPLRRDEEIAELARRDGLGYAPTALVRSARSLVAEYFKVGRRSLWRDAEAVTAPTLVLHGSGDRLVNPVMAVKAARSFRSGRVVVLPAVGHVAMMERPAAVADEIGLFLTGLEDRSAGSFPDRALTPNAIPDLVETGDIS